MKLELINNELNLQLDLTKPHQENIRLLNRARNLLKLHVEELEKLWKLECEKNVKQTNLLDAISDAESKTE